MGDSDKLEGNIAIVALIVSLTALIVTLNQLLLQLFSSADGYRRCAESVIGAWHTRRHRVWKWTEFRFETQYVTPQIVLMNQVEFEEYQDMHGDIYAINGSQLEEKACKELNDTVHQEYSRFQIGERVPTINELSHASRKGNGDIEKSAAFAKKRKSSAALTIRTRSDPLVSWLRLLRDLHRLSRSYWPNDCPVCQSLPSGYDELDTGAVQPAPAGPEKIDADDLVGGPQVTRTDIAVIYRTWTWDFMPPDMVRPLAEINVGDVTVLAMRMGMQWRAIEPEMGKMQADGNGYSLTATDVRGLGVVLRFTAAGPHQSYPRIIPSRAVDKMLCSLVPGDPVLVRRDFPCRNLSDPGGILSNLGFPEERRRVLRQHAYFEIRNDTVTLLLPFLPLEGSTMTKHCFRGWSPEPTPRSVYTYWEGRIALHRQLKDRIRLTWIAALQQVLDRFEFLEQTYSDDWYARWHLRTTIRDGQSRQSKLEALDKLRQIFNWTTKYFVDQGCHSSVADGISMYMHLVAAHANLVDYAVEQAKEFAEGYPGERAQDAMKKKYGITPDHGAFFVFEMYEVGIHYVKHLNHPEHGIRTYMKEKGIDMSEDDVEAAWWVMQLRGIVFHLSSWRPMSIADQVMGDPPIPYHFYGNKTPVWIT